MAGAFVRWDQMADRLGQMFEGSKKHADKEVAQRGAFAPVVEYDDGSHAFGLPGLITEPWQAMKRWLGGGAEENVARMRTGLPFSPEAVGDALTIGGSAALGSVAAPKPTGAYVTSGAGKAPGVADDTARATLPMDEASRMARAREMGFDTSPVYHGSDAVFDEFDMSRAGQSSGNRGFLGTGAYFADNPSMASNYGRNVGDYFIRPGRQLDMTQPYSAIAQELPDLVMKDGMPWVEAFAKKDDIRRSITDVLARSDGRGWVDLQYKVNGEWISVPGRISELAVSEDGGMSVALAHALNAAGLSDPDNIGALGNYFGSQTVANAARVAGFDSAKAHGSNFWDGGNEYVVFDPRNIRSKFAAFDPAQSSSANLLAANPKEAAALYGAFALSDKPEIK